jgi:hypothetical protein
MRLSQSDKASPEVPKSLFWMARARHPEKMPYRLALIEWVDASRLSDGWMDLAAIPDPYRHACVSVGFVVAENGIAKILVPTIGDVQHRDNSHTYGGMMIPVSAIIAEYDLS